MLRFVVVLAVAVGPVLAQEGRPRPLRRPAQDPALQEFIQYLVARFDHPNPIVRRAVRAALVAVGKPAEPALVALAQKAPGEGPRARAIARVLRRIRSARPRGTGEVRGRHPRRGGPAVRVRRAAAKAHIPEDQVPELVRLVQEHREAMRALRRKGLSEEEMRRERRALVRGYMERLRELLGPDKAREFLQALWPGRGKARRGEVPPHPRSGGRGGSGGGSTGAEG